MFATNKSRNVQFTLGSLVSASILNVWRASEGMSSPRTCPPLFSSPQPTPSLCPARIDVQDIGGVAQVTFEPKNRKCIRIISSRFHLLKQRLNRTKISPLDSKVTFSNRQLRSQLMSTAKVQSRDKMPTASGYFSSSSECDS